MIIIMGSFLTTLFVNFTHETIAAEDLLAKIESSTDFETLKSIMRNPKLIMRGENFSFDRLFRAVSSQLDRFWLPELQNFEIAHEEKQAALDDLCELLVDFMDSFSGDAVDQVEDKTLEKLFRSLVPFLIMNVDDSTNWTPKCVDLKLILWQFAFYDHVEGKYKQNQTKLLTTLIGLMTKVNETPESEFNLFADTYSNDKEKGRFLDALAFMLDRFEWAEHDLMDHIEFDKVLFACYRFMQPYEGNNLWSLNLKALGRVKTLVRYIAERLSGEIVNHLALIKNEMAERRLNPTSVVLLQYLKTLITPLEVNELLDTDEEDDRPEKEDNNAELENDEKKEPYTVNEDSEKLPSGLQSAEQNNSTISSLLGFWS